MTCWRSKSGQNQSDGWRRNAEFLMSPFTNSARRWASHYPGAATGQRRQASRSLDRRDSPIPACCEGGGIGSVLLPCPATNTQGHGEMETPLPLPHTPDGDGDGITIPAAAQTDTKDRADHNACGVSHTWLVQREIAPLNHLRIVARIPMESAPGGEVFSPAPSAPESA